MYRIWTKIYKDGEYTGASVSCKDYTKKGNAIRVARSLYGFDRNGLHFEWIVSETNPWDDGTSIYH